MTKGTHKIASKNPQKVDERENPSLLNRPYFRGGGSRSRRARCCVVLGSSSSLRNVNQSAVETGGVV